MRDQAVGLPGMAKVRFCEFGFRRNVSRKQSENVSRRRNVRGRILENGESHDPTQNDMSLRRTGIFLGFASLSS